MINVLQRLNELDSKNPRVEKPMISEVPMLGEGIKQLNINMPEPNMKQLKQLSGLMESRQFSNTIAECGMPGMGAPMPSMPASLNMSAGNASEIVAMMRGLADIASGGGSSSGMQAMGAPMPAMPPMGGGKEPMFAEPEHDMAHDGPAMGGEMPVSGPTFGDDAGETGGDELANMMNKLRTGQPVKISTDMPVKVKTTNPVSPGAADSAPGAVDAGGEDEPEDDEPEDDDGEEKKTDESARLYTNSPKESNRDYNPNDFAQMFNKIKDLDQTPYGSGSNPLPRNESVEAPVEEEGDSLSSAISKLFSEYNSFVNESKTKEGNAFGKAVADAKKDGVQKGEKVKVGGKEYSVKEAGEKTMSRAAKGNEKYGKAGMQALAKAGKEGKSLDKVRDKYNKYD
jgi:hypothetical protein